MGMQISAWSRWKQQLLSPTWHIIMWNHNWNVYCKYISKCNVFVKVNLHSTISCSISVALNTLTNIWQTCTEYNQNVQKWLIVTVQGIHKIFKKSRKAGIEWWQQRWRRDVPWWTIPDMCSGQWWLQKLGHWRQTVECGVQPAVPDGPLHISIWRWLSSMATFCQ